MACSCQKKALAAYPWDECMRDQMARYGSEETARKVCASIKRKNATVLALLAMMVAKMPRKQARLAMLALVELEGDAPTEFRIFRRGMNETSKGPVLFDDDAARAVMADYTKRGVELMIDLAHSAMYSTSSAPFVRSDASDARGWFKLAMRNGELWAVDVRWTADGMRRLTERTQRYISPAVYTDKNDRAVALVNVALCSMPATFHSQPLVAASENLTHGS